MTSMFYLNKSLQLFYEQQARFIDQLGSRTYGVALVFATDSFHDL